MTETFTVPHRCLKDPTSILGPDPESSDQEGEGWVVVGGGAPVVLSLSVDSGGQRAAYTHTHTHMGVVFIRVKALRPLLYTLGSVKASQSCALRPPSLMYLGRWSWKEPSTF